MAYPNPNLQENLTSLLNSIMEAKRIITFFPQNQLVRTRIKYYRGDGEKLPSDIFGFDIVLAGYLHHHMNFHGRKLVCQQMEDAARRGGFIGVVDFYVPDYSKYMEWYKPHFEKHGDAPPVEYPLVDGKTLSSFFRRVKISSLNENLEKSFMFYGVKIK